MFKVGDKVRVVRLGGIYNTYQEWAKLHKLYRFVYGAEPSSLVLHSPYGVGEIIAVGNHTSQGTLKVYGVKLCGFHYVYAEDALKLVEEEDKSKWHKHHDLIVAWAKGAEIEAEFSTGFWVDAINPTWSESVLYRIKPEADPKQEEIKSIREEMDKLSSRLKELEG